MHLLKASLEDRDTAYCLERSKKQIKRSKKGSKQEGKRASIILTLYNKQSRKIGHHTPSVSIDYPEVYWILSGTGIQTEK
jgi:hypothetical protein